MISKIIKSIFLNCTLLFFVFQGFGQKVTVAESDEIIEDVKRKGLYTVLELDLDDVKQGWTKKMKEWGSFKNKSGTYIVEQGTIASISSTFVKIISKVEATSKGSKVWFAIDLGDAYVTSSGDASKYKEAEKLLHDFGVAMYIADINDQIKEAEKVLASSVKDQEKLINKGEKLRSDILSNRQEKVKLEKKLTDNAIEYKQLQSDSVTNLQNQAAASEVVEKTKKAVEAVRAKVSKVE
ncbi:MAG: hypothetical protein SFY32_01365 [Bacteroidota bacterium]|nr:hypothetical protein [Bacteroidota bacterium]